MLSSFLPNTTEIETKQEVCTSFWKQTLGANRLASVVPTQVALLEIAFVRFLAFENFMLKK